MRTLDYRTRGFTSVEEPETAHAGRMKSGAATIEFAYSDFCVAQLSRALGKTDEANRYQDRAQNWLQVWNPTVKEGEYAGFPNSRHQNGTFTVQGGTLEFTMGSRPSAWGCAGHFDAHEAAKEIE